MGWAESKPWEKQGERRKKRKGKKPREEDDDDILRPSKKVKMESKDLDATSSGSTDAIKDECSLEDTLAE